MSQTMAAIRVCKCRERLDSQMVVCKRYIGTQTRPGSAPNGILYQEDCFATCCVGSDVICTPFPTTFCRYVPQFPVTSDQKLVTSDQKGLPSDHKAPDHEDVVVTDNECGDVGLQIFGRRNMQFANQPLQRQYYWQYLPPFKK